MNRAERRGNHTWLMGARPRVERLAVDRNTVIALEHHARKINAMVEAAESGKSRNAKGRFVRAAPVVPPATVHVETRQQRRHAALQAAKKQRGGDTA
jgi:hypothetical protein